MLAYMNSNAKVLNTPSLNIPSSLIVSSTATPQNTKISSSGNVAK
jgi:hypothetical protein